VNPCFKGIQMVSYTIVPSVKLSKGVMTGTKAMVKIS
jgi:hypothetical protein